MSDRSPSTMWVVFWRVLYITTAMLILSLESGSAAGIRAKRVIAFQKGSTFFYRLNYKITSISTTTIFAQATGFKVAWQLPSRNTGAQYRRSVDDVHESAKLVYESHGFDGKSCLAKHICQALEYASGRDGVMAKILKLLSGQSNRHSTTSALNLLACKKHSLLCPLELVSINSFP